MTVSPVDVVIFAPLAPLFGVLLFWFIQLLFIESQKYLLSKIWNRHKPLCRFTNFLGVLYQTICHALGYTVTKSGISNFYVSVDYGKVAPKKEKKGIFEWMSNSFLFIGPFFIPALLLLICFLLIKGSGVEIAQSIDYTFAEGLINFGTNLYAFSENLFLFLVSIDLLHPPHIGFLILLIFLGMGIRPSYIGEEKQRKVNMLYDLQNIKAHIFHKPLYILMLFLLAYVFSYISVLLKTNWYTSLLSIFGWLSIVAIVSLIIAHMIILLIKTTDEIPGHWRLLPFLTIPISYALMRFILPFLTQKEYIASIALFVMLISTIIVVFLLLKYTTNKLKTTTKMKESRIEDGPKRSIRK
ncbi:MAG: hypothetical protein JSW60_05960 [Thermoplasmatales archaeon]|nr:MAG: hypothetical protein JSW60_05960 [Thermoplasmatales archaeon]